MKQVNFSVNIVSPTFSSTHLTRNSMVFEEVPLPPALGIDEQGKSLGFSFLFLTFPTLHLRPTNPFSTTTYHINYLELNLILGKSVTYFSSDFIQHAGKPMPLCPLKFLTGETGVIVNQSTIYSVTK